MSKKLLDLIPEEVLTELTAEILANLTTDQLRAALSPEKLEELKTGATKRTDAEINADIEKWAKGDK